MEGVNKKVNLNHRLLLFPAPFTGHLNPMLNLASILHSKGFSITIIQTHYNPINPAHYPNFNFHTLEDGLLKNYSNSKVSSFEIISVMNKSCLEPFKCFLDEILREVKLGTKKEKIGGIVIDPMWGFAGSIVDKFKVPRFTLRTGNMSAMAVYCSLDVLREKGYFPPQDDKLEEPIQDFPPLKVKDLPSESDQDLLETLVKETKTSQGLICNTFEELESSSIAKVHQLLQVPIFTIGPLHKHQPNSNKQTHDLTSIEWLDTQKPNSVLYVSFGTVADLTKGEFIELAFGLLQSSVPFLWVIRPGLIRGSGSDDSDPLPEGYLEMAGQRGRIIEWAPQLEVLAHSSVGGFWTHNGWNSTLESICEGIPMLCQPVFGDQRMNARHVSENWKVGVKMERGVKREDISRAIRKLMFEEGEEMRKRVGILKDKANLCIEEGGSSYNSLEQLTSYLLSF